MESESELRGAGGVVPPGPRAGRKQARLVLALLLFGIGMLVRHFVVQSRARDEILSLSRVGDAHSVGRMAALAMKNPDCWSRDPEVVEAIASSCSMEQVGWHAERALMHAEVGGPSWRRVVTSALEDDVLEFDDERVLSAVRTIQRQRRPLAAGVLEALSQRLRWACQDRDKEDVELVRGMVELLSKHEDVYDRFRQSLTPIEAAWLDQRLAG